MLLNPARPERGTKRTCLNCEARFYDLARVPAICPKCGTEYVEIVRPAPIHHRKRGALGKGHPGHEVKDGGNPATYGPQPEEDDPEPDEEREEGLNDEDEQESEVEDSEE